MVPTLFFHDPRDSCRFFGFFSAQAVPNAQPADCQTVDLSPEFGSVRQQGSSQWCYAFTYADLLGHALKIKPPDMVSANDVAITYITSVMSLRYKKRTTFGRRLDEIPGGKVSGSAHFYRERGRLCLESQSPSESLWRVREPGDLLSDKKDDEARHWLQKQIDSYYKSEGGPRRSAAGGAGNGVFSMCSEPPELSLKKDDDAELQKTVNDFTAAAIRIKQDRICPQDKRLRGLKLTQAPQSDDRTAQKRSLADFIRRRIGQRNPVGISYQPCIWRDWTKYPAGREFSAQASGCQHASSVIGRRWNPEKRVCEYAIRNSWGATCPYVKRIACEKGVYYVPLEELIEQTDDAYAFDERRG